MSSTSGDPSRRVRHRAVWAGIAVALAVTVATTVGNAGASGTAAVRPEAATPAPGADDRGYPFSDPVWYPMRSSDLRDIPRNHFAEGRWAADGYSSLVACVVTNCLKRGEFEHNFEAIDWVGSLGDPVYAAGGGIVHVEDNTTTCVTPDKKGYGQWLWIDHGGGTNTHYRHLTNIQVKTGDIVTPRMKIAEVGGTGTPCAVRYVHYELRRNGELGVKVYPGSLRACYRGRQVLFPEFASVTGDPPYRIWNDIPTRDMGKGDLPKTTSDCIPGRFGIADPPTSLRGQPRDSSVALAWNAPSRAINHISVEVTPYRPQERLWGRSYFIKLDPTQSNRGRVPNLDNGRNYRFRVAFHTSDGYSAWSPLVEVTPALPPTTPTKKAGSPKAYPDRINLRWGKSYERGSAVTGYEVAIRQFVRGAWSPWTASVRRIEPLEFEWGGLASGRLYNVRVRALSKAGPSKWLTARAETLN